MVIQRGKPLGQNPAYRPSAQFQSNGAAPGGVCKFFVKVPPEGGGRAFGEDICAELKVVERAFWGEDRIGACIGMGLAFGC